MTSVLRTVAGLRSPTSVLLVSTIPRGRPFSTTCTNSIVHSNIVRNQDQSTGGAGDMDLRPPSSQIFTQAEVSAGIKALAEAGYDADTVWEQRVVWGDHDQFQHVNNVHFVRWFESARMFFANKLTEAPEFSKERREEVNRGTGKSFILAGINVRYRRPVLYPDTILVGQACELPLGKDRFMLRGAAYSLSQKTIVAVSAQDCVTYDYTQLKKCDIPQDIRDALEQKGSHFDKKL